MWRRERHVCPQVTAGEVDAVLCAEQGRQQLNAVVAMGPIIDSAMEELSAIRKQNHFAERFRDAFEGGGG
jgi:hypothetical protein